MLELIIWVVFGGISVTLNIKYLNNRVENTLLFVLGAIGLLAVLGAILNDLQVKYSKPRGLPKYDAPPAPPKTIEEKIDTNMEKLEKNVFLKGRTMLLNALKNAGTYGDIDYWSKSSKKLEQTIEHFLLMTEPLIENDEPIKESTMNINQYVVIYPSSAGWYKIEQIIQTKLQDLNLAKSEIDEYMENRKTTDDGYKEQLWVIMSDYGDLFFNGSTYLKNTTLKMV